jgi:hypothetical protein
MKSKEDDYFFTAGHVLDAASFDESWLLKTSPRNSDSKHRKLPASTMSGNASLSEAFNKINIFALKTACDSWDFTKAHYAQSFAAITVVYNSLVSNSQKLMDDYAPAKA